MHVALEEEKRQEKLRQLSQPKKQGWFKPGTEALGSVSASTYGTRSGSSSQTSLPTESTARAGRRKSVTMMTPDSELEVGVGASTRYRPARRQSLVDIKARPTYTRTNSEPSMMAADCDSPVAPGMWGMPPLEVKIKTGMSESTGFRLPTDDISIASTSVASGDVALTFSPHSPSDVRSESCQLPTDGISVADSSIASSNAGLTFSSDVRSASLHSSQSQNQIVDALISGMGDDRMADITLVGRDGAKVRATKFVLACRSPVLQEKLYQDPTQVEVFIGDYGEDAIRAMKEYCHTEAIKGSSLRTKTNDVAARGLVELASLAKVYGFEPLYGEADSILYKLMNSSPWLATASYDSAGSDIEVMEEFLLQFIKSRCPDLLLETSGLKHMGQQRLLVLLDGLDCNDAEMLKYLEKWIELKGATREHVNFLRATAAKKLNLARLLEDPEMVTHVRSSGIFDRYMVESIINASPIMEEEGEQSGSDDEDDEEDDDQMETHQMNGSCSNSSKPQPTGAQMEMESPGDSSKSSKDKKKKKKDKHKEKKEKKKKHKKSSKSRTSSADMSNGNEATSYELEQTL